MQLTLDHAMARAAADDGMRRALDHAERTVEKWGDLAFKFLELYARRNLMFTGEEVTAAAKTWGLAQPPSDRAWGSIYKRAQNAGVIVMDGVGRRAKGHGSIGPRWRSLIYGVPGNE